MTDDIPLDDLVGDTLDDLDLTASLDNLPADVRAFDYQRDQRRFVSRLVSAAGAGELPGLLRAGFNATIFDGPIRQRVEFLLARFRTLHALPSPEAILKQYADFADVCLLPESELAAVGAASTTLVQLYDEVRYDAFLTELTRLHEQQTSWFNDRTLPVDGIWQRMQEKIRTLGLIMGASKQNALTFGAALDGVVEQVRTAATEADWGIQVPFPFLNDILRGYQPGELTTIVAKTGVGKTWAALMSAASAITGNPFLFTAADAVRKPPRTPEENRRDRKRVLLVSLEMPVLQLARRLSALLTKLGYGEIRSGKFLDAARERKFFEDVGRAQALFGDSMLIAQVFTADEIAAYADMVGADLVIVDGFYLMGGSGEKRWERVQDNAQAMRLHSLSSGRHYLLTSQMARGRDELAFSQSIEQDSSTIVELHAPSTLRQVRKVVFKVRKARDGELGKEFLYSWDYTNMRVHEEGPYLSQPTDTSQD